MLNRYENKIDAVTAAHAEARRNGLGYAYAMEWADHWSVEDRKPHFRGRKDGRVSQLIECRTDGKEYFA